MSNSIRLTLNIKDPNVIFLPDCAHEEQIKGVTTVIYSAKLSPDAPKSCPACGTMNINYSIIKNGLKKSDIKLPRVSNRSARLRLAKQRYFCKSCSHTFSAQTEIVNRNCSISTNTFHAAILDSKQKISIYDLSKRYDISHSSLNNWLHNLHDQFVIPKDYLPENLCFDEFKSVKTISANMSFIFADASTGHVVDIVVNRQLGFLKSYFFTYTKEARDGVKTICIDMYSPYIELIRSCFPNAKIIIDRFHVIQLISRSLNSTRIQVMNDNPKARAKLKRYWRLFLKDHSELDHINFRSYFCFKFKMTELQVLSELLRIDPELEATYWFYQDYLRNFRNKNIERCEEVLRTPRPGISKQMKKTIITLEKYQDYIRNSLTYTYSNGVIEGTNNLIKVIKRIAFGYRNYENFKTRILLITNTLVRLEHK